MPNSQRGYLRTELQLVSNKFGGKPLHCADLNHFQVSYFARNIQSQKVLLFGVLSKKETLEEYREKIIGRYQADDYYNKCTHYLLELVGQFMSENDYTSDQLTIIFEKKNHDYQRMRNYLSTIRRSPVDGRAKYLQRIDPISIQAVEKKNETLLSIADLTAFSLRQSFDGSAKNFGIPEQRYLRELKPKFFKDQSSGKVANVGIKFVKGPFNMSLKGENFAFAMKFYSGNQEL